MSSKDVKLPPNWTIHFSNTRQKHYYFNKTNGQKSWEKPSFENQNSVSNTSKTKFTNIVNDSSLLEAVGKKFQNESNTPAQNRLKRLQDSLKKDQVTSTKTKITSQSPSRKSQISKVINSKTKLFNKSPQKLSYSNNSADSANNNKGESSTRKRKHDEGSVDVKSHVEPIKKLNSLNKSKSIKTPPKLLASPHKKTTEILLSSNRIADQNIVAKQLQDIAKSPAQNRLNRLQQSLIKDVKPPITKTSLNAIGINNGKDISSASVKKSLNNDASPRKKARRLSVTDDEDDNLNDNNKLLKKNEETIQEKEHTDLLPVLQPQSIFGGVFQWAKSIYNGAIGNSEDNCTQINNIESTNCISTPFIVNNENKIVNNDEKLCGISDIIMTDDDNSIGSDDSMDWDDVIIPQQQPEQPTSSSSITQIVPNVEIKSSQSPDIPLTELLIPKINSINDRLKKNIDPLNLKHKKIHIVVDTNIFISNLYGLKQLINKINEKKIIEPQLIIILPYVVLKELDKLKTLKDSSVSVLAQRANRYVNEEFKKSNGIIRGQSAKEHNRKLIEIDSCDDEIINCCLQLKENVEFVELLSNDVNLQNKAMCSGFTATSLSDLDKKLNVDTTDVAK